MSQAEDKCPCGSARAYRIAAANPNRNAVGLRNLPNSHLKAGP
jgi:hypothetical protein